MPRRHSKLMLVVMAIVLGGCTTIQRAGKFLDPMKTSTTETQIVAESRDASADESGSPEALPAVGQTEQETSENETNGQGTAAKDIGKAILATLAVLVLATTVAANIAFIAAVSHRLG